MAIKDYHKYFSIAQFVCAVILFLCTVAGFAWNVKNIIVVPDGAVILLIGLFVVYLCYLLVREAYKELKK
ncbi:MAG: hypothetical protein LBV74_02405 [Tannerella sp.]|jgi:Flp pilus assembly protein TadB|nr:hypothetical protein [Tannerella sp.]